MRDDSENGDGVLEVCVSDCEEEVGFVRAALSVYNTQFGAKTALSCCVHVTLPTSNFFIHVTGKNAHASRCTVHVSFISIILLSTGTRDFM